MWSKCAAVRWAHPDNRDAFCWNCRVHKGATHKHTTMDCDGKITALCDEIFTSRVYNDWWYSFVAETVFLITFFYKKAIGELSLNWFWMINGSEVFNWKGLNCLFSIFYGRAGTIFDMSLILFSPQTHFVPFQIIPVLIRNVAFFFDFSFAQCLLTARSYLEMKYLLMKKYVVQIILPVLEWNQRRSESLFSPPRKKWRQFFSHFAKKERIELLRNESLHLSN